MNIDELLFEPKKLFLKSATNYVSPENVNSLCISQLHLQPEDFTLRQNINLKFQSVQNNGELERVIEGIPIPIDDISMSSLTNNSFVSMTPQQKQSYNRVFANSQSSQLKHKYKHPTPMDSVLTSLNQQQIVEWSKSNVKPATNGNIFPQVLAPSIDLTNETTTALSKPQHTFGSFSNKEPYEQNDKYSSLISSQRIPQMIIVGSIVEITKYNTQLRTQVLQQQSMINDMMNQIADGQEQSDKVKQQHFSLQQSAEKNQRLKSLVMEMKTDIEDLQEKNKNKDEQIRKLNEQNTDMKKGLQEDLIRKGEIIAELKVQLKNNQIKMHQMETDNQKVKLENTKKLKNEQSNVQIHEQNHKQHEKDINQCLQNALKQISSKLKLNQDSIYIQSLPQFEFALDKIILSLKKQAQDKTHEIEDLKSQLELLDHANQKTSQNHLNQLESQKIKQDKISNEFIIKIQFLQDQINNLITPEECNDKLHQLQVLVQQKANQLEFTENQLKQSMSQIDAQQHIMSQNKQNLQELQNQLDLQEVMYIRRKNESDNKLNCSQKLVDDQDKSKNFIEFIQQLLQKIQVYENEIVDLKHKLEEKDQIKGVKSLKSTFISQNNCLKTQEDEETSVEFPNYLAIDPERMSDEETILLLLKLLSRICQSKHMQKQLKKNKDFQVLLRGSISIDEIREKTNKLSSTERYYQFVQPAKDKMSFVSLQSPKQQTNRENSINNNKDNQRGLQFSRKTQTMTNLMKKQ